MICWHMFYTTSLMNHKLIVLCVLGLHIIVSVMHWSVQINLIDFKSKIQNITWFARSKMAKVLCAQRSHCDSTFGGGWEGHRVVPVGTGQERSWKSVCVCTFSKEVKPVLVLVWFSWWSFWQIFNELFEQGGRALWCYSVQWSYASKREGWSDQPPVPATCPWWWNSVAVSFLFFFGKLLFCTYKGTSSFMTSALDALVFVKVCNLWWVSDKVPQGRGVAPVQLLSRRTPDSMILMSNLQTLIGNSPKYFSLGSRFLLAFYFSIMHYGGLSCLFSCISSW